MGAARQTVASVVVRALDLHDPSRGGRVLEGAEGGTTATTGDGKQEEDGSCPSAGATATDHGDGSSSVWEAGEEPEPLGTRLPGPAAVGIRSGTGRLTADVRPAYAPDGRP
ncbi:hypothetical protein GCM10010269_59680 [Streptomyces humidus]|uniref:Uncharacterized protein n=1 Tax=Streptomyces humidus TaxID=52259 RepID=A0A918L658_9ACTN|nr:hypothetical protein GCM10010269_59680 [Streptomyces humidus]